VDDPQRVFGKDEFDLESDPPPDIAVEIDVTTDSIKKLAIYAALRVPEVWRYDGETLRMYGLGGAQYEEIEASRFLTGLTGPILGEAIKASKTQGQTAALDHFLAQIAQR
jgi:Uma2 family endonuclease